VTKPGSRVIFAEGRIFGPAGEVLATATSSLLVLAPGPGPVGLPSQPRQPGKD
jgi:hypothetical protein